MQEQDNINVKQTLCNTKQSVQMKGTVVAGITLFTTDWDEIELYRSYMSYKPDTSEMIPAIILPFKCFLNA